MAEIDGIRTQTVPQRQMTPLPTGWLLGIITVIAVIAAAKLASAFVIPTVLAGLAALALSPMVRALERIGCPSGMAAAAVVGSALLVTITAAYTLAPSAEEWRARAPAIARSIEWELRDLKRGVNESVEAATAGTAETEDGESPTETVIESGQRLITDAIMSTPGLVASALYVAVLSYFLLAERIGTYRALLCMSRTMGTRLRVARAIRLMRVTLSRYLFTISIINTGLGAIAGAIFYLFGLPNPVLWGAMVAVLNFAPFVGPMVANVVIFCVGVVTFHDSGQALYPVLALVTANVVEGQLVTPMVVGQRLRVAALSVFMAVAFGAWLWGPLGALLATPILIVGRCLATEILRRPAPARGSGIRDRTPLDPRSAESILSPPFAGP